MAQWLRKNIKAAREKDQTMYKGRPIRITPNFSVETKSQEGLDRCSKTLRDHRCQHRILYSAKLSVTID
jgi:hypothetical protein